MLQVNLLFVEMELFITLSSFTYTFNTQACELQVSASRDIIQMYALQAPLSYGPVGLQFLRKPVHTPAL